MPDPLPCDTPKTFLRITAWDAHYETSESRRITDLAWVATPNGHDSVAFCQLLRHPNGMAHFGAWNLILQVASKCSIRGLLSYGPERCRKPHTAATVADITHASEKILAEAIPRLLEFGWLEEVELDSQQLAGLAQRSAGRAQRTPGRSTTTGQDRTGQDTGGEGSADAAPDGDGLSERDHAQRAFLVALGAKMQRGSSDLFPEWKAATKGIKSAMVESIFKEAKPGITWPSEFKKHREARGNY